MTTLDNTNPSDLSQAGENGSPLSRLPIPWIKIGQYLFLAALICTSIISFVVQDKAIIVIWMAVLVSIFVFLVLVDKLDIGVAWFKWLPVIFPAIASIVASVVTSFPFQENWISANTAVELLEAEREKFILGVTQAYRCYDLDDQVQRQKKLKQAIENFINQVNTIHLKQIQEASESLQKPQGQETEKSASAQ